MKIINKADKYSVKNDDYTLMIGDADIVLVNNKTKLIMFNWNFKSKSLTKPTAE